MTLRGVKYLKNQVFRIKLDQGMYSGLRGTNLYNTLNNMV